MKYKKYTNGIATGVIFIVFIVSISAFHILTPDRAFSDTENRVLEQLPNISWDRIIDGRFTAEFESYIKDQFPGRDMWVGVKSDTELLVGKRDNNEIFLGEDGYLLQKFDRIEEGELRGKLEPLNLFASSLPNVNKYFMLVPNSVEILSDRLPKNAPVFSQREYMDKIAKGLSGEIEFIDIYENLYSNREEYIYYRTDHHWTSKGAYYGYRAFMDVTGLYPLSEDDFYVEKLTDDFYGTLYSKSGFRHIKPDSIEIYRSKRPREYSIKYCDKDSVEDSIYDMDALKKKDKYEVFLGGNYPCASIATNAKTGRKLLLIKDSYANSMVQFLTEHYDEIYLIDLRYYDGSVADIIINREIDDILILYNVITFSQDDYIYKITK